MIDETSLRLVVAEVAEVVPYAGRDSLRRRGLGHRDHRLDHVRDLVHHDCHARPQLVVDTVAVVVGKVAVVAVDLAELAVVAVGFVEVVRVCVAQSGLRGWGEGCFPEIRRRKDSCRWLEGWLQSRSRVLALSCRG